MQKRSNSNSEREYPDESNQKSGLKFSLEYDAQNQRFNMKEEKSIIKKKRKTQTYEEKIIQNRKNAIINFIKTYYNLITYVLLAFIIFLATRIRTRNIANLKDITTGTWTLGPDSDPFLFLRWSEYIVENGKLFAIDPMRFIPLGYEVNADRFLLHPYLMAWFHKIAVFFSSESVTYSAIIYPVFMFALTIIAFFLFTRKIFIDSMGEKKANIIALISSFFFSVIPILLPRTIAGIPEKESAAFLFIFLTFYFFLSAWKSKSFKSQIILAVLAGLSTGAMALTWGVYPIIFLTIIPTVFISLFFSQLNRNKIYLYVVWLICPFIIMLSFVERHTIKSLLSAEDSFGLGLLVICTILINSVVIKNRNILRFRERLSSSRLANMPLPIISILLSIALILILSSIFLGSYSIINKISHSFDILIKPTTSKLIQTVAENQQPFFVDLIEDFGPFVRNIPIFFWLFFLGSIYLFYRTVSPLYKKDRIYITLAYSFLLTAIIFSRHSFNSVFNGTNRISVIFYAFGFMLFIFSAGFYYCKYYKNKEEDKLKKIDIGLVFLLILFLLSLIAARGHIRLIMILVPSSSIIVSYFVVATFFEATKIKKQNLKVFTWVLIFLVLLATFYSALQFYKQSNRIAEVFYVPSPYNQEWQKAMAWVRENTPETAVFSHWWDYGYWIQSIGKRATVLDGGNAISYWNHLMGRHVLTGSDEKTALEFLYAHNATHFLIDSTDIGKYPAISSIGSDANNDRMSSMRTFVKNDRVIESNDSLINFFDGVYVLYEDIIYNYNQTKIFLPAGKSYVIGIIIIKDKIKNSLNQTHAIFLYNNKKYMLPIRYTFDKELIDFNSGVEAGIFLMPSLHQNNVIEENGALLYLPRRVLKSQFVRFYLYEEEDPYFKLVHSQDHILTEEIKSKYPEIGSDFIYINEVIGPIRIWEINYPKGIELKKEYLEIGESYLSNS